ncbi:hypothetical protein SPRG_09021 [Saprolegnia parasitica CBS 223.65]|uniref:Magnesium transporter n=1 Tax=Saprolegnia parasitica (strain CBS 223.65) TaxID=695850 RepID=A0A067CG09_SAPPC|nr:hypothetical protein SPRG_09021 [Saprolegnia parasitica CBS 223.65]KDO25722.1 hypothetical protein SPRG_09021 [Saprolegnia parasitica CBS 223.65]|eukprot:XP_012203532.1 hypothetical protein SPRG_09021 [Saprolegnia parasitica CBS 223.65]
MTSHSNLLGGAIAFGVAVISNYGINLQKQLHRTLARDGDWDISYTRHCVWWWGMFLVTLGSVGDLVAFSFARAAVVAAVGGVTTIIANVVFAQCVNHEPVHKTDMLGIASLIGAVILLAVASRDEANYDVTALLGLFGSHVYLTYVGLQVLLLVTLGARLYHTPRESVKSLCFAAISGTVGAMTYVAFSDGVFYGVALALVVCVASQTHCLNRAVSNGDIMAALPIFQMFWIGLAVVGDIVFYHTYTSFTTNDWLLYLVILGLMVVGCTCVASSRLFSATDDNYLAVSDEQIEKKMLHDDAYVYL